ncbi:MAG: DUF1801 domain-containing protein, partial [Alphaproteobacteria bacterium]|nr:DUF1801 domain-containing protein [Alphaproteobacteria bacterium]
MAEAKTKATAMTAAAFIAALDPPARRADAEVLCAMLERVSGCPPVMWGPGIVGFARYAYRYDSGRTGEWLRIGFSPRAGKFAIYGTGEAAGREALLARLGRHKTGADCVYVAKLADVDMGVLEELLTA